MNPLPRFLALALFVALSALVALLAGSLWQRGRGDGLVGLPTGVTVTAPPQSRQALVLSQRLALALATIALALTILLLASRPTRPADSTLRVAAGSDVKTLARLAKSSLAQGAQLDREREVRHRAEEDVRLKQRLLSQSLDEKMRLGRDLHDGIIQSLYAVGLTLESVRELMRSDPGEADRRLEQIRASLNNAIRDVRAYITGLAPANLHRAGFAQAVNGICHEMGAGRDAHFDVRIEEEAAALLTPDQSLEALQIAREAMSNALRHGGASRITVRVHKSDKEVCLLVQDNGAGFDAAARRDGGHGLANMQARAERLSAALRISSQPGEGTRIVATLPILSPSA
ncbi:MAG: hypothetical protein RIQ93_1163 [Verrucomicrobiota bacterium]|jgi:signal transduction histidine kinase